MTEVKREWFEDFLNVKELAWWLIEESSYDAKQVYAVFAFPWHYTDEWVEMQAATDKRDEPEPPDAASYVGPEARRLEAWNSKFGPGGTHNRGG